MTSKRLLVTLCVVVGVVSVMVPSQSSAQSAGDIRATMMSINGNPATQDLGVQLVKVEYNTVQDEAGQVIYFDNRSKQMGSHWVPGDPERGGYLDISWLSDLVDGTATGLDQLQTQMAVDWAMATWDSVKCATIPLYRYPDFDVDWGYIQFLAGYGGTYGWLADITQAGWLPGSFFDWALGAGAAENVIGVTFTFVWIDGNGDPTDVDNNGKDDVAFREIYYNNFFPWGIDTDWPVDTETIVLHETGHGLSLGHFGKLFRTDKNGKLHFAPKALMNAGYTGIQQTLRGTDNGAFCSIWGSWPNN
jgi:hypothetical protein